MICLRYGNTNTYFLNGLLIDTDLPQTLPAFRRALKSSGVGHGEIRYVLATHYHPDHVGLIGELMAQGTKLLLIDRQKPFVHFPDAVFARQKDSGYRPIPEEEAEVISAAESRKFLAGIGIAGEIVPTESHSADGVALITDGGDCFVGDLEPRQWIDAYEDPQLLRADWERIMRYRPKRIFYGHANEQQV